MAITSLFNSAKAKATIADITTHAAVEPSETAVGHSELATTAEMTSGTAGKYADAAKVKAFVESVAMLTASTRFKVGNGSRAAGVTGAQDISSIGFNPKAVIIIAGNSGMDTNSVGLADSSSQGAVMSWLNGSTTSTAEIVYQYDGTNRQKAIITLGTNKFTLTWSEQNSPSGTVYYTWLALA